MRLIIRVRNDQTKRYRIAHEFINPAWVDSQHFDNQIHGVPMMLDSIICNTGDVWVNLTPAWNKKRPKDQEPAK